MVDHQTTTRGNTGQTVGRLGLGAGYGAPAQVFEFAFEHCYRFALTNPNVDVCLCGPQNMEQMKEALNSLTLGPLTPEEMIRLKKIGDHVHTNSRLFW